MRRKGRIFLTKFGICPFRIISLRYIAKIPTTATIPIIIPFFWANDILCKRIDKAVTIRSSIAWSTPIYTSYILKKNNFNPLPSFISYFFRCGNIIFINNCNWCNCIIVCTSCTDLTRKNHFLEIAISSTFIKGVTGTTNRPWKRRD